MTRSSLPLFAAIAIAAVAALPRPAMAIEYPWCAQYGGMGDDGRNCGFSTLAQCMATVSGIGGGCERNAFYSGPTERPIKRTRQRKDRDG